MSWRSNGGYFGPRPTGPSSAAASGWWDSRSQFRNRRAGQWPTNGDPFWSDVILLLEMDGSNGSTTFTDTSPNAFSVTANGNAQISTAQAKYGQSALFDGSGDYLTIAYNSAFNIGASDFTAECWVRFTSLLEDNDVLGVNFNGNTGFATIRLVPKSNGSMRFLCSTNGSSWITTSTTATGLITTNTWYHLAGVRSGNTFTLYIDGTSRLSYTSSSALHNASGETWIGAQRAASPTNQISGNIDSLRLTKAARYTENFTPPTSSHLTG